MEEIKEKKNPLKQFIGFLKEDSWKSLAVLLLILVLLIKFIIFPMMSFITSSSLPLVVIQSCSMYHEAKFDNWWDKNIEWYETNDITKPMFKEFPFRSGLNKGDIIFVWGRSGINKGDVIIFKPNPEAIDKTPIIHRVIGLEPIETKGDHNSIQLTLENNGKMVDESNIPESRVIGKAIFKIPLLGWVKLIFFEPLRPKEERGFCS